MTGAVINARAVLLGNGPRVAGVAVGGHLLGLDLGDQPGRAEKYLSRGHIADLTKIDVDQVAVVFNCRVEIAPFVGDLEIRLVDLPSPAGFAGAPLAQALSE
jgi:hypothetical protein